MIWSYGIAHRTHGTWSATYFRRSKLHCAIYNLVIIKFLDALDTFVVSELQAGHTAHSSHNHDTKFHKIIMYSVFCVHIAFQVSTYVRYCSKLEVNK